MPRLSNEAQERKARIVRNKMKRKRAWGFSYLEELARNQAQVMINEYVSDRKHGETRMVKFLLRRGFSVKEIVREARRVRKMIVSHHKKIRGMNK